MTLPLVDAILNATATALLVGGFVAIKSGRRVLHQCLMLSALAVSAAFLACYLYYHFVVGGEKRFEGGGWTRTAYLAMLVSHIVLAAAVVPLALTTVVLAWRQRWERHRRWARVTFPIWLYVSVTGVLIYLCLYG